MNIKKRTISRFIAVQILYQYSFFEGKKEINKVKDDVIDYYLHSDNEIMPEIINDVNQTKDGKKSNRADIKTSSFIDMKFLNEILENFTKNMVDIDKIALDFTTTKNSTEILTQILRLAILELKFIKSAPKNVIVSEYANITSRFYDKNVISFANAVLENIAKTDYPT